MNLTTYRAARDNAAWRDLSHFGRFIFSGREAPALLHHLTTNDIKGLKAGRTCDAALITSKARVLDLLTVSRTGDQLQVITSPNRREGFAAHCARFIVYRQDVRIEDVTARTSLVGLFGPRWKEALAGLVGDAANEIAEGSISQFEIEGAPVQAVSTRRLPGGGCLLWSPTPSLPLFFASLAELPKVDDATYNVLRIEAKIPVTGLELTEEINPWEAGFDYAISLHKGCYNGQEVVARLNTYKKVKQHLFLVKIEISFPSGERPQLLCEGRNAGFATSSADSPVLGPIALAYIKGDFEAPGQRMLLNATAGEQNAQVIGGTNE